MLSLKSHPSCGQTGRKPTHELIASLIGAVHNWPRLAEDMLEALACGVVYLAAASSAAGMMLLLYYTAAYVTSYVIYSTAVCTPYSDTRGEDKPGGFLGGGAPV